MKLKKIILNNFQSFQNAEIDFDKLKIVSISAFYKKILSRSNGAGKSSIFDAIIYGLYGKSRTKKEEDLVRENTNEMSTELEFELSNNETIKINRGRAKDKSYLNLEINGEDKSEGKIETQKIIENKIGMDYELFIATVFFQQEGADKFTGATPTERKNYLKKLFKLEIYDRAYKKANEKMKAIDGNMTALKGKLDYLKEQSKEIDSEKLKKEIEKDKAELEKIKKEIIKLSEKKDEIFQLKQKLESLLDNKEDLKDDLEEIEIDIKESEDCLKSEEKEVRSINCDLEKSEKYTDEELEKITKKGIELNKQMSQYESDIKIINNDIKRLKTKVNNLEDKNECSACNNKLTKEHKEKVYKSCNQEIKELEKLKSSKEELKNKKYLEIEKEKGNYRNYKIKLNEYNELISCKNLNEKDIEINKKLIQKNIDKKEKLKQQKKSIEKQIAKIDIPDNYSSLLEEIDEKDDIKTELVKNIQSNKSKIENYKKSKKEYKEAKEEYDELKNDYNCYNVLKGIFGKNGIVADIIKESIDEIEEESNNILQEINNGEYRVIFETEKETKKGSLNDSLDIYVENNRAIRVYESYSGGQRAIINFAIRMALSKILSKLNQVAFGIVFLDEVMGSLDEYNREKMIDVINYLKPSFLQILVISHTNLKECFENEILVEYSKNTGISKIKEIL